MASKKSARPRRRVFLNAGCGTKGDSRLPAMFRSWEQVRVDLNPAMEPDIVASVVDLSAIEDSSVNAIWCAHCMEHLYAHQVPLALMEFRRVLKDDGFVCIVVPDLQEVAQWISNDRLQETIYESAAGPVTAQDMIWGFGPALFHGMMGMAHHCGFTPTVLLEHLKNAGFSEIVLRRKPERLELAGLALQRPCKSPEERNLKMSELGL
jgi:SAM-dependent methyltransferase